MKKVFKTAALCLAVAGMGVGYSSCDSESVIEVLSIVAQMLQGQTTNYKANSCTATYYATGSTGEMQRLYQTTVSGMTASITCSSYSSTAVISFNDVQLNDSIKITGLSISSLVYETNAAQTQVNFTVGDNSTINGTMTINGTAYSASNLFLTEATATNGKLSFNGDIYFNDDNRAVNYTFTATQIDN